MTEKSVTVAGGALLPEGQPGWVPPEQYAQ